MRAMSIRNRQCKGLGLAPVWLWNSMKASWLEGVGEDESGRNCQIMENFDFDHASMQTLTFPSIGSGN